MQYMITISSFALIITAILAPNYTLVISIFLAEVDLAFSKMKNNVIFFSDKLNHDNFQELIQRNLKLRQFSKIIICDIHVILF